MRRPKLESILTSAVALAMTAPGFVAGCSETEVRSIENDPGFVKVSCDTADVDMLEGLSPEPPVDFIELRSLLPPVDPLASVSVGERCGTATDAAACATAVTNATSVQGFFVSQCVQVCPEFFLVVNRGDDVFVLDTASLVTSFLGKIDTPEEAIFVARLNGLEVPCGRGGAMPSGDGFDVQGFTHEGCDGLTRHIVHVGPTSLRTEVAFDVEKEANPNCVVGRRPGGLPVAGLETSGPPLATYLANAARLEAASVHAFENLANELSVHGAPKRLIAAARRAARDEVRHARSTARLSRRFGAGSFRAPRTSAAAPRSLEAIAIENAAEGCVRETFGAAVGMWQARHAKDRGVRRVMHGIARDEMRHASLAWAVDRWLRGELGPSGRNRMDAARKAAVAGLASELEREPTSALVDVLGVPSSGSALRLHAEIARTLWTRS